MASEHIILSILGAIGVSLLTLIGLGIQAVVRSLIKNTTELAILNSKIESLIKNDSFIPKMREDINELYRRQKNSSEV